METERTTYTFVNADTGDVLPNRLAFDMKMFRQVRHINTGSTADRTLRCFYVGTQQATLSAEQAQVAVGVVLAAEEIGRGD